MLLCGITQEETEDIERVQKVAVKMILKANYTNYNDSLDLLDLENLQYRRSSLCLKFAKTCLKNENTAKMFPLNTYYNPILRNSEKYDVKFAHNNRLRDSAIPVLQQMINKNNK